MHAYTGREAENSDGGRIESSRWHTQDVAECVSAPWQKDLGAGMPGVFSPNYASNQ